jgi:hypothetical protein
MSIINDFEINKIKDQSGGEYYNSIFVEALLVHARALETLLKKHEFGDHAYLEGRCLECGADSCDDWKHEHDCELAKLLEGVDANPQTNQG